MIDFSKAPNGATHYHVTSEGVVWVYFSGGLARMWNLDCWMPCSLPFGLQPIPQSQGLAKQGHPHAALMAEYAKDAAETDKPWERWECRVKDPCSEWKDLKSYSTWNPKCQYRRKGEYIIINGHEVKAPLKMSPDYGSWVYVVLLGQDTLCKALQWSANIQDVQKLKRGILHATSEAAIAHAKALLSFTEQTCKSPHCECEAGCSHGRRA